MKFTEAILDATRIGMEQNPNSIFLGLGVNDDRGLQGTTKGLVQQFGEERVFDIPVAEDAMMGFAVGSAMCGVRTIFNHARIDFLLLTFNQLFNVACKYSYMFNGAYNCPLIIRALVGHGWGGQHSQVLSAILASFPGISVVMPSNPPDAKGLLLKSFKCNYPVVFIEDFQLYDMEENVRAGHYEVDFNHCDIFGSGDELTIVTLSSASRSVKKWMEEFPELLNRCTVLVFKSVTDIPFETFFQKIKKSKKLLYVQNSWLEFGFGAELLRNLSNKGIKVDYAELGFPFAPTPSSEGLLGAYYVNKIKFYKMIDNLISFKVTY
jgi:acetoin:2,6-dichlorophenolindophenol oxidoreductase subunit beta